MPTSRNLNRQRMIAAAIELFSTQGVTETTTKQIAEAAAVNEVTLFRQFGNKHGLLLAVIEESEVFSQLGQNLVGDLPPASNLPEMLREYANTCLQALEQTPAVIRSLVGESGQYSIENRQALGKSFDRANRRVAKYLKTALGESPTDLHLPVEQLASLLNTLLFGYATIELTSEFHGLWRDREDFLDRVVALIFPRLIINHQVDLDRYSSQIDRVKVSNTYPDLPEQIVHQILERAKKQGLQIYAIVYVLFGAGLSVDEIIQLNRSEHLASSDRQILQITNGLVRQVPINQWILGKRYGSYVKNPLTQWLRSRKDSNSALFIGADSTRLTEIDLRHQWQQLTSELLTPTGQPPAIEQTQSTWCVEMLVRGLTIETMQLLTGREPGHLEYYLRRATEQIALAQAVSLDRLGN
jgi:AcrR family transcriptional regulator